jgi:hypothetical protein
MTKGIKKMPIKAKKAKRDWTDLTALIRSIQRAEGNPECFGRPPGDCDQFNCEWRRYCLEELKKHCHDELEPGGERRRSTSHGPHS